MCLAEVYWCMPLILKYTPQKWSDGLISIQQIEENVNTFYNLEGGYMMSGVLHNPYNLSACLQIGMITTWERVHGDYVELSCSRV